MDASLATAGISSSLLSSTLGAYHQSNGEVRFFVLTLVLVLALIGVITPVLGWDQAKTITVLMIPSVMWWARIFNAILAGRITKRFVFLVNPSVSGAWQITNPDILERKDSAWDFYGYVVREGFWCLVLWLLMAGGIIYPRMAQAFGWPH